MRVHLFILENIFQHVPTLRSLYKPGDLVTCCVDSVSRTERGSHKVLLSLNPSDINREKSERILEENVVLVGAVKSKEDHGFSVDLGIEGVTAFLPFKRVTSYCKTQNIESLGRLFFKVIYFLISVTFMFIFFLIK